MMRLILMLFLLSLASIHSPVLAQQTYSEDCIPDEGCPEDVYPPKCCNKPKCGLFRGLQVSRALRQNRLQRRSNASSDQTVDYRKLKNEDFRNAWDQIAFCPDDSSYRTPPEMRPALENNCEVSVWDKGKPQESILQGEAVTEINACKEVIEAVYEYATSLQPLCESEKKGHRPSDAERIQAELDALQAQIDWLDQELWGYWKACSAVFSADTARLVAQQGVDALRDARPFEDPDIDELAPLTPQPKKASRSGKKPKGK